jgi:hypothetical protein
MGLVPKEPIQMPNVRSRRSICAFAFAIAFASLVNGQEKQEKKKNHRLPA